MSYPKQTLSLRPTRGFISDTPAHEVGPEYWTAAQNVIFRDGFATRISGFRDAYATALGIANPTQLMHGLNCEFAGINYWILLEKDGTAWAIEGDNATQIDDLLLQAVNNPFQFSSALLNGLPIISNSTDEPVYWAGGNLVTLPDWTATESAEFIAVFKFHVFAMNLSGPGGSFENLVKWSAAAEPGTVPASWTPAADNDAGSVELSDSPGQVLCAYPLSDALMIYKNSATYQAQYVGGQNVFSFRKVQSSSGALSSRSVCDVNGRHFIVSDGDILLSDGTNIQSIGESRIKNFLFDQIDQTHYRNLFCTYNRGRDEVIVGFPTVGNEFCNKALVYDVSQDAFGVRDLNQAAHAPVGFVNDEVPSNTWSDRSDVWADATDIWGSSSLSAARDSLVLIGATTLSQQDVAPGTALGIQSVLSASVGKYSMSFGEPERLKFVRRLHIRVKENSGPLLVRVGGQMTPNGPTTWSAEVAVDDTEQIVNCFAQGRYISVEARSNGNEVWKLTGLEIEAELRGYH